MKTISWIGLILVFSPIIAFGVLAFLHPVGDPQESHNLFVRILDFQGTYWIRNGLPVPPPLLIAGLFLSIFLYWRFRITTSVVGIVASILILGLWCLIMIVPLLIHVN